MIARSFPITNPPLQVSTQWNRLLRSLDLLKPRLSSWYGGSRDLRSADYAFCTTEAQNIHAYRIGSPKSCFKLSLVDPVLAAILVGETLVWQPHTDVCRTLFLLNLKTWHIRSVSAESRFAISSFCASDQLVVLSTLDGFYVFTIHDLEQKKFKTPNHAFREAMTCRGRTVACAANFAEYMEVYVWDYDTQRGRSFQIRQEDRLHEFFARGPG